MYSLKYDAILCLITAVAIAFPSEAASLYKKSPVTIKILGVNDFNGQLTSG